MTPGQLKRIIYITAFIVLGILLQQFVHAGLEMAALNILVTNFNLAEPSPAWNTWRIVHGTGTLFLLVGGILFGYWMGVYWWNHLYDAKGNPRRTKRRR